MTRLFCLLRSGGSPGLSFGKSAKCVGEFPAGVRMPDASCDIGLIGLAVMGQNLVLNMNDHGFKVAVFNLSLIHI